MNDKLKILSFSKVYDAYIKKIERKGKDIDKLDNIISWLTSYSYE